VSEPILAAGGIPVREGAGGVQVVVVHRTRYGDWTFPKGKREQGEDDEQCALREVEEETGLACALEEELPTTWYTDGQGRSKRVRWWRLRVVSGELQPPRAEIDDARWVSLDEAAALITYERDRELLRRV
jgi:8-oxo-dGTP pyrophosphatase MutT (NUDIX family)